jgi:hypothetical protein
MVAINPEFEKLIYPLTEEELSQLKNNIGEDGILDSIKVWNKTGDILDGHNRYRIAKELNLEYNVDRLDLATENDAILWIINNQLGRRNLLDVQRIELAKKKNEYLKAQAKENQLSNLKQNRSINNDTSVGREQSRVAKDAGVSTGKVAEYGYVERHGTPEEIDDMKKGRKKVHTIYTEVREVEKMEKITDTGFYCVA